MKKLLFLILIGIFLINLVSAVCTVTLDKTEYSNSETATVTLVCNEHHAESSQSYTLNWTNSSGYQLEIDTGTTPKADGSNNFFASYVLPSTYFATYGTGLNATLNGTNLEGIDNATISATGGVNDLVIKNIGWSSPPLFLGDIFGAEAEVVDENDNKLSGALCEVVIEDINSRPIIENEEISHAGEIHTNFLLGKNIVKEGTQYLLKFYCYCGVANTSHSCISSAGGQVELSSGYSSTVFKLDTWLSVNTIVDKTNYAMKDDLFVCANLTNLNSSSRIPVEIFHQVRCSSEIDNNDDLDRILILEDSQDPDERGISANTTQMQCKKFKIPESDYLQGKTSECYASTSVWVLDDTRNKVVSYATTSPVFNITSTELNIDPDWQWVGDKKLNSVVNLSDFININGTGTGDIDIRITDSVNGIIVMSSSIELFNLIENITVKNTSSTLTEHVDYELEFLEDGQLEIEIRNVALTKTGIEWYNITLEFYDNILNQTISLEKSSSALEGIENKTGTFHLSVDCPVSGTIGQEITCSLTAYIEDLQLVQKEVDFTCHISNGVLTYSAINFNQMITKTPLIMERSLTIPSNFITNQQYVLQCYADYYNLGSRRDSFYDTFTATTLTGGGGSGTSEGEGEDEEKGKIPITGGAVDEGIGNKIFEGDLKFGPINLEKKFAWGFLLAIISLGIAIFLLIYIKNRKKHHRHLPHNYHKKTNWKKAFKGVSIILGTLLLLTGFMFGIVYFYKIISSKITLETKIQLAPGDEVYSFIQDDLFRGIILTGFIVLMIIILFRSLDVSGELKFGRNNIKEFNGNKKLSRLQNKLDKVALKNAIKSEERKKHYKFVRLKRK